jgi:hypothetical protein
LIISEQAEQALQVAGDVYTAGGGTARAAAAIDLRASGPDALKNGNDNAI